MILQVKLDSVLFGLSPKAVRFYFWLLTKNNGGYKVLLHEVYTCRAELDADDAILELLEAKCIVYNTAGPETNWYIGLGTVEDGLYVNAENYHSKLVSLVRNQLGPIVDKAGRRENPMIDALWSKGYALMVRRDNLQTVQDLMSIWRAVYAVVYREEPRDFIGKEVGQFKMLFKLYGTEKAPLLVVHYLMGAKNPNIGELLFKKDTYFHQLFPKTNAHVATFSDTNNPGGFF